MSHCGNIDADRRTGATWERNFCRLAARYGKVFTPMQLGRTTSAVAHYRNGSGGWSRWTLPDVTVWTAPGEHHEIKHKEPTRRGLFGLEEYRFRALVAFAVETQQDVLYTIHNHQLAGGKYQEVNRLHDWVTVRVLDLKGNHVERATEGPRATSYVNGQRTEGVPILYWPENFWMGLDAYWHQLGLFGRAARSM